jgi:hypothetical protein
MGKSSAEKKEMIKELTKVAEKAIKKEQSKPAAAQVNQVSTEATEKQVLVHQENNQTTQIVQNDGTQLCQPG